MTSVELSDKKCETDTAPLDPEEARIRDAYARRKPSSRNGLYSFFNRGNVFMLQERERRVLSLLNQVGWSSLQAVRILDVGCGAGFWIRDLIRWGASPQHITGVDLLEQRVAEARCLSPEGVTVQCRNATALEFPDGSFDLIIQSTVFTSILDRDVRQRLAHEMLRVLRPGGLILWYDFHVNNPRNPDVRGVTSREIHQLFQGCLIRLRRITLAPPVARVLAPISWFGCQLLSAVPLLCTHYLGAIRKPSNHD
ncbi:MAG: class I SAM-dependent methyltransferase [Nitrospira defluvii]|nr:class I SAM-dependent methyltransferase [Nitrospira defluvii]